MSTISRTLQPIQRAVSTASSATGRSPVPAVITTTLPAGSGRFGWGMRIVRAVPLCWASGNHSNKLSALSADNRVPKQSCPCAINTRKISAIASAVLPSQ